MKPTPSSLVLILVLGLVVLADSFAPQASNDFDFFILAQTWPPSFYFTQERGKNPMTPCELASDFCIHGLWPNKDNGFYPEDCNPDSSFTESKVSDLIPKMESNWPKLSSKFHDNRAFWSHQWERHGTCSESVLDQHAYFETALELKAKVDLINTLRAAGIEPKDGEPYKISRIKHVIKGKTGHAPIISCISDGHKNKCLYEIWLCITEAGLKFRDCPNATAEKLKDIEKWCGGDDESIDFPSCEEWTTVVSKKNKKRIREMSYREL